MTKEYLEALECLDVITEDDVWNLTYKKHSKLLDTIKQALLKAQEQEKENAKLKGRIQFLEKKYNNLMEDKDNLESELFKLSKPKKYLKCEDLDFDTEWKYQEVKLNGTKYTIKYKCGFDFFDNYYEDVKIYNQDKRKQLFELYNNEKFFNDLHFEVE